MREPLVSVGVPKDDRFQVIAEHDAENFVFDPSYLDLRRTEDLVIIQIIWNEGRTVEQKKALSQGDRRRGRQPTQSPS